MSDAKVPCLCMNAHRYLTTRHRSTEPRALATGTPLSLVCFHCKYHRLRNVAPSSCLGFKHSVFSECRSSAIHCLWHRCPLFFLVSTYVVWSRCTLYGLNTSHKFDRSVSATDTILTRYPAVTLVRFTTLNIHASRVVQVWFCIAWVKFRKVRENSQAHLQGGN